MRGLPAELADDLVLAVSEAAANSIRHGLGRGLLRVWSEDGYVVCEVSDRGHLDDPLAGRRRPEPLPTDSRGLWLIHHLCDLVQIRSTAVGHGRSPAHGAARPRLTPGPGEPPGQLAAAASASATAWRASAVARLWPLPRTPFTVSVDFEYLITALAIESLLRSSTLLLLLANVSHAWW